MRHYPRHLEIRRKSVGLQTDPCPGCGRKCARESQRTREIVDLGSKSRSHILLSVGMYRCPDCGIKFSADASEHVLPLYHYTRRTMEKAIELMGEMSPEKVSLRMRAKYKTTVPPSTLRDWRDKCDSFPFSS